MIERRARVLARNASTMQVAVEAASACAACGARKACQGDAAERVITLPAAPGVAAGEAVSLSLDLQRLSQGALLAYLLPASCLLAGALIGETLQGSNLGAMLGAALGLLAGLVGARQLSRRLGDAWAQPRIQACPSPTVVRSTQP